LRVPDERASDASRPAFEWRVDLDGDGWGSGERIAEAEGVPVSLLDDAAAPPQSAPADQSDAGLQAPAAEPEFDVADTLGLTLEGVTQACLRFGNLLSSCKC
jgi:hypothetical protein